ncbi:hypothetical protein B484DRAFT_22948 [Ochromonadaceae sp. CCMP2298]|nr:hypothetical protein B484DRAFT_22948 [Ochromonadaceae sp. CCMP2298]
MARKGSRIAGNWRFGSHAAPLLLALLLLALVVGVRGTETNASAPEAEQRDCSQIYLDMHNPFLMQPTPMKGQRSVSSNHKTGTFLIWCLQKMMHTDYRIKVTIGSQREAGAFSPLANQLNMVRNPFTLIHSAYEYHRKGMEGWSTIAALKHKDDPMLNLHPTYRVYANWCNDTKTRVNQSMSYRDMLNHLPLHQGLLMEAVRSSRTIGNMMAAAASCANIAALTQGQPGSCVNLLLDELMEDFPGSYRDYIVPALNLNLPPAAAMRFQKKCDLTNSSSKMLTSHTTEKGDKRVQAVLLIRQLDEEVLGGR